VSEKTTREPAAPREPVAEERLRVVRTGHGANCSSIGSVIDTLFATATLGAAVFAAVAAALAREDVQVVRPKDAKPGDGGAAAPPRQEGESPS
jgi:hypothetical protein